MDTGENNVDAKGKKSGTSGSSSSWAKPITWPVVISDFLLDWYIEKKLTMPPKAPTKQLHHTACTVTVNTHYGTTYSVVQVYRHWRKHRDTWSLAAKYINESGSGWDATTKQMGLSQSTLNTLSTNDRGILSKPIQFFDKLQELFSGSTADGSFMQDPSTAAESEYDDVDKLNMTDDMVTYAETDVPEGEDLDKLESDSEDFQEVASLSATGSQVSSSNIGSMKPNQRRFKRVGTSKTLPAATQIARDTKPKTKATPPLPDNNDIDEKLTKALTGIQKTLEQPLQTTPPPDPNAPLWDMLKNITLTPDDKFAVGAHLCKPELQVYRGFLINIGQAYLERWVCKFLSGDDPGY